MARKAQSPKVDMYQEVTDAMLAALESGETAPWHKPWSVHGGMPQNHSTGKAYRGVNVIILMMRQMSKGYDHNLWLTYKQCAALKGQVLPGEKGTRVVFYKFLKVTDKDSGKERSIPLLRCFTVFNVAQCDGLTLPVIPVRSAGEIDETAEALCTAWPVPVQHGGNKAAYSPSGDKILMPERTRFDSTSEYYSARFHEMGHSTGHKSRLDRPGITAMDNYGSHQYGIEELIAELTSSFLCVATGVNRVATTENSANYLAGWIKTIQGNPKMIVQASQAAQKASDAILIQGGMMEAPNYEAADKAA